MLSDPQRSLLDHPAISGSYLLPQPRLVDNPISVEVDGAELACYRRVVDPDGYTVVHFHGNGETVSDYVPDHKKKLSGYSGPLLILHTERDGPIDISHAERNLKWAASSHKRLRLARTFTSYWQSATTVLQISTPIAA